MKKLLSFLLFIALSTAQTPLLSLDALHALRYTGDSNDIYTHIDISAILTFFEKSGIPRNDIPLLFGTKNASSINELADASGRSIFDIKSISIAARLSEIQKDSDMMIIISLHDSKQLPIFQNSTERIGGRPAHRVSTDKNMFLIQTDNLLIISTKPNIEAFLDSQKKGKPAAPALKTFLSHAENFAAYNIIILNAAFKQKFQESMKKDPRTARFVKNNPYISAIYNLDRISWGFSIDTKNTAFIGFDSSRKNDGKLLEMFSHFLIVGTSFAASYFESSAKNPSDITDGNEETSRSADIIQSLIAKLRTEKSGEGVRIVLDIDEKTAGEIISAAKKAIVKEKELAKKNEKEKDFNSAVKAAEVGDIPVLEKYLTAGGEINYAGNNSITLLSAACDNSQEAAVLYLLGKGANPEFRLDRGETVLIRSAEKGFFEIVKLLVRKGADKTASDESGRTAADRAEIAGFTEIAEFLRK